MEIKEGYEYFQCTSCGAIISIDQRPYDEKKIVYPTYCEEEKGGCGRKSKFLRLKKEYAENPALLRK